MLPTILTLLAVNASGVSFETESCAVRLETELLQLGPELPPDRGWVVQLSAGRLTVVRPDRSTALRRAFAQDTSCDETVKASALILERFFRALPRPVPPPAPKAVMVANPQAIEARPPAHSAPSSRTAIESATSVAPAISSPPIGRPQASEAPPFTSTPPIEVQSPARAPSVEAVTARPPPRPVEARPSARTFAPEPAPVAPGLAAPAEPTPISQAPSLEAPQAAAPSQSIVTRGLVSADLMLGAGTSTGLIAGGSVRAHIELADHWRIGLRLGVAAAGTQNVTINNELRGTLMTLPTWAAAQGQYCTSSSLRLCAGLDLGARFIVITPSGKRLYRTAQSVTATPTFGAVVGVDTVVWRGLLIGLHVVGLAPVLPQRALIEGASPLELGNVVEVFGLLSIGWAVGGAQ